MVLGHGVNFTFYLRLQAEMESELLVEQIAAGPHQHNLSLF
jgi:hypothetical protein